MTNYILGYIDTPETDFENPEHLTHFKTIPEADFEADEWVVVEANSLHEAKLKYREFFENWQKSFAE